MAGRPSKYAPAYCDEVIAAGDEGLSLFAFAGSIGVARSTINEWIDAHPDFREAVEIHKAKRALTWEKRLSSVSTAGGGPGQATAIIFGLKNVAPSEWRDHQQVEHSGTVQHQVSDLEAARAIAFVLAKGAAQA